MRSFSSRLDIQQAADEAVAAGDTPTILTRDVQQARGTLNHLIVEIFCPHCWERHTHGAEKGEAIGYRVAHCDSGSGHGKGYIIEIE